MNKLGEYIKNYRLKHNLTFKDFSKICDLSASYLSSLEKGVDPRSGNPVTPTIETLEKIAKGTGSTLQGLLISTGYMSAINSISNSKFAEIERQALVNQEIFKYLIELKDAEKSNSDDELIYQITEKLFESLDKHYVEIYNRDVLQLEYYDTDEMKHKIKCILDRYSNDEKTDINFYKIVEQFEDFEDWSDSDINEVINFLKFKKTQRISEKLKKEKILEYDQIEKLSKNNEKGCY